MTVFDENRDSLQNLYTAALEMSILSVATANGEERVIAMENEEVGQARRLSVWRKDEVVIALLEGGDGVELAREYGVSQAELYGRLELGLSPRLPSAT